MPGLEETQIFLKSTDPSAEQKHMNISTPIMTSPDDAKLTTQMTVNHETSHGMVEKTKEPVDWRTVLLTNDTNDTKNSQDWKSTDENKIMRTTDWESGRAIETTMHRQNWNSEAWKATERSLGWANTGAYNPVHPTDWGTVEHLEDTGHVDWENLDLKWLAGKSRLRFHSLYR